MKFNCAVMGVSVDVTFERDFDGDVENIQVYLGDQEIWEILSDDVQDKIKDRCVDFDGPHYKEEPEQGQDR